MSCEAALACIAWLVRRPDTASDPVSFFAPMSQILFWAMVAGIVAFFFGFKWLRFRRRIQDTPFSKMGSASIGLVEVSGKASGPRTIPAALTGAECLYYRAIAWQRPKTGNRSNWQQVADESVCVPFFVEDSTGKLHVRPEGAEMEVHQTLKRDYDAHIYRGRESWPEPIRSFLGRNGVDDSRDVRLEEHCIKPGETLFVIGTLGETPGMLSWDVRPHFGAKPMLKMQFNGPIVRTQTSSWKIEPNDLAGGKNWIVTRSTGPVTVTGGSGGADLLKEVLGSLEKTGTSANVVVNKFVVRRSGVTGQGAPASGASDVATLPDNVLAEISKATGGTISPEKLSEIIRQAKHGAPSQPLSEPVPEPEQLPKVGIGKGRPEDPFFISWRSQKEVASNLGRRAQVCIYGGPAVAVVCLYLLLLLLGRIPVGRP